MQEVQRTFVLRAKALASVIGLAHDRLTHDHLRSNDRHSLHYCLRGNRDLELEALPRQHARGTSDLHRLTSRPSHLDWHARHAPRRYDSRTDVAPVG